MSIMFGGVTHRVRTYSSGKRVRQTVRGGKVIKTRELPKIKTTKTQRHLNKARRRIRR